MSNLTFLEDRLTSVVWNGPFQGRFRTRGARGKISIGLIASMAGNCFHGKWNERLMSIDSCEHDGPEPIHEFKNAANAVFSCIAEVKRK